MVEMGNMSDGRNPNTEAPCLTSSGLRGQGLETETAIYIARPTTSTRSRQGWSHLAARLRNYKPSRRLISTFRKAPVSSPITSLKIGILARSGRSL